MDPFQDCFEGVLLYLVDVSIDHFHGVPILKHFTDDLLEHFVLIAVPFILHAEHLLCFAEEQLTIEDYALKLLGYLVNLTCNLSSLLLELGVLLNLCRSR